MRNHDGRLRRLRTCIAPSPTLSASLFLAGAIRIADDNNPEEGQRLRRVGDDVETLWQHAGCTNPERARIAAFALGEDAETLITDALFARDMEQRGEPYAWSKLSANATYARAQLDTELLPELQCAVDAFTEPSGNQ